jgi:methionyl aminopeptidase
MSMPEWARGFSFTGALRPALYSPKRTVPPTIRRPDYADHFAGVSHSEQQDKANHNSIRIYTPKELDGEFGLRHACRMGREVLDEAGKALRPGVTTDEIDRVVHEATIERDCYPSPLNYYNFPKSVCTSVNEVVCHGIPDYREVQDGDIVNIDVSTFNKGGYHGDLNETFWVGKVDADGRRLVKTSFDCLAAALAMVKPGTLYRDLGTVIEKEAKSNKCSVVRTYCGHGEFVVVVGVVDDVSKHSPSTSSRGYAVAHAFLHLISLCVCLDLLVIITGIGSLFHTIPNIPHYHKNKAKGTMKEGHVFTVEPMINLGHSGDILWGDNWTSSTADGKRSAQFEHTVLVTATGCEILTARNNEPIMNWNPDLVSR